MLRVKANGSTYDALLSGDIMQVLNWVYPVGSVYLSMTSTNPGTVFGGTWIQIGQGKTLIGVDASDTDYSISNKSGGSKTHALTTEELPSHSHESYGFIDSFSWGKDIGNVHIEGCTVEPGAASENQQIGMHQNAWNRTKWVGGDQPFSIVQPYLTVYMWQRTA